METATKRTDTKLMHIGTGLEIGRLDNLPVKQQKKIMLEFFLKAQEMITKLDVGIEKEAVILKQINKDLKESTLNKKKTARQKMLNEQRKLKAELHSRYSGALELAQELGIDTDLSKIKMIEGGR